MGRKLLLFKRALLAGAAGAGVVWLTTSGYPRFQELSQTKRHLMVADSHAHAPLPPIPPLPTREQQLKSISEDEFDVLVIGGGATGAGVALDAQTRGLKTAMVEKFDFSAGTSSRSTKLIHGGVRYLQKAIFNLDREQYRMVKEALSERANLLDIAPHLSYPLPIMLPIYKYWQVPYYWAGIKCYDLVAGSQILKSSYYLTKTKSLELFPMLKKDKLKGALVYYDGQHNDARMNIAIALTAARQGATIVNHAEVIELIKKKNDEGKEVVCGAKIRDMLTSEVRTVNAKCVINATGPYTDTIRGMETDKNGQICQPSSGVHIVLPDYYSPEQMGLLDPSTSDGRVIFFLPWQKCTLAGTTDNKCEISDNPRPTEEEIQFILREIKNYLNPDVEVRRGDVLSAWSGIRPLVCDPNAKDTQNIARNHIIEVGPHNLITIAGGKWTTYRNMAEETVDKAIKVIGLEPKQECVTKGLLLDGAEGWTPTMFIRLVQDFGLESEVAKHLSDTYGDRAFKVAKMAALTGKRWPVVGKRLHEEFPYIDAEVRYACREYAATAIDVIARRTRLCFLNVNAALEALPTIVDIMAEELKWDAKRKQYEMEHTKEYLKKEMGLDLKSKAQNVPINFTPAEINKYMESFRKLDTGHKGYITVNDIRQYFKATGEHVTEQQLHDCLSEVDLNKNAQVSYGEYLQLMSAVKTGAVSNSRFAMAARLANKDAISITRSGGGV